MADKSAQLVLTALSRAAAEPAGVPLLATKTAPGLFAATATGKQLAQRCKDEGYLRVVQTEARGKVTHEVCALSDKGLTYLLGQVHPRQVLEDFVRVLESRQEQVEDLLATARLLQANLGALQGVAVRVLEELPRATPAESNGRAHDPAAPDTGGPDTWTDSALTYLARWRASGASEDCTLPELYRQVRQTAPALTIGQFHDGLRRLNEEGRISLPLWTGPLYALPEPPYALLVGHGIAYYASHRNEG